MNYFETFIQVAPDYPAKAAVVPAARGEKKSIAMLEFELLSGKPYFYTQEELQFEVHLRHKGISARDLESRRNELWAEFFSKPHACLRASSLPKKYGFGVHFDAQGKISIYAVESKEYQQCTKNKGIKQLFAMRSQRV
jgi:hypothetical protein